MSRRAILLCLTTLLASCEVVDIRFLALTPTRASTVATAEGGWYHLYFTDPPDRDDSHNRPEQAVDDYVIASINAAQRTVDAASYDFNLPSMAEALIDAHKRGLIVRLVTDTDALVEDEVRRVVEAEIGVAHDDRSALMHDKFVIVDGRVVWTGSWNFSENDTYRNNNNVLAIAAPQIVANYQVVFDSMFKRAEFSQAPRVPYPEFDVEGTSIENYFSPDGNTAEHILSILENAQHSIYFAAFAFTRDDFAQALVERAQAGVTVRGVFETRQVDAGSSGAYERLDRAGLPVLLDGNRYTMHHKFFVVDEQIVVTGSYNFSNAAEENNNENVLIIHSREIAGQYAQEFTKVWRKAEGR